MAAAANHPGAASAVAALPPPPAPPPVPPGPLPRGRPPRLRKREPRPPRRHPCRARRGHLRHPARERARAEPQPRHRGGDHPLRGAAPAGEGVVRRRALVLAAALLAAACSALPVPRRGSTLPSDPDPAAPSLLHGAAILYLGASRLVLCTFLLTHLTDYLRG